MMYLRREWTLLLSYGTAAVFFLFHAQLLERMESPLWATLAFVWLFGVMMISVLLFFCLFTSESFPVNGEYSPRPEAVICLGTTPAFVRIFVIEVARITLKSQLSLMYCDFFEIGTLSVCPSTMMLISR